MCVLDRADLARDCLADDRDNGPHHHEGANLSSSGLLTQFTHDPRRVARHKYDAHSIIFLEGDPAERLFEVVSGAVMLYKLLPDGRRQVVELLSAGDIFGVSAVDVYDCAAESLTPSLVAIFDKRDTDASELFQKQVTRCLTRKVLAMHDHAVTLGRKSALERVATFIIRFIPTRGSYGCTGKHEPKDDARIHLTMTRQEIADYLGLTLETVSRAFSELRRRGILTLDKQDEVIVNNICGLCQLTGAH